MKEKKDDKFLIMVKEFIKSLVISLIAVIVVTQFFARPVRVEGMSMYPTLDNHETGFSNIIGVKTGEIKRFDIVVVYLEAQKKHIVKRVIGLPGEKVEFKNDVLYINDVIVEEPFLDTDYVRDWKLEYDRQFTYDFGPVIVEEGSYFAMGDNRPNSSDSREYGFFKKNTIKSKDVFIILPLNRLRHVGR